MITLATHVVADNPLEVRLSDYCVVPFAEYNLYASAQNSLF